MVADARPCSRSAFTPAARVVWRCGHVDAVDAHHQSAHVTESGPAYVKQVKPLRAKKRTAGLSLRATDGDFAWGEGPEVAGPEIDLIMAMIGGAEALDRCEADGIEIMRSRC
jgi:hypothetical protein